MVKCEYKIIDNVLSKTVADEIVNQLLGNSNFPWYYNNSVLAKEFPDNLYNYQFTHNFYTQHEVSSFFPILFPLVQYLNPESILRIKANLIPRTEVNHRFNFHIDFESESSDRKTAIYYVNSNNGVTVLEDGTEIEAVANRFVIFNQKIFHTGTSCTDQKIRSVINFNYIERTL
jgi:hypothetical protein